MPVLGDPDADFPVLEAVPPRVTRGRELAAQLTAAGIKATADPRKVAAGAPIVLVSPPRLQFTGTPAPLATWRLLVVAGSTDEHVAWTQLDTLLAQLEQALPLETADPTFFGGQDSPRPAYAATYNETVES